jgi:hypothetical protein
MDEVKRLRRVSGPFLFQQSAFAFENNESKVSIVDLNPGLKSLLNSILTQADAKGQFVRVSWFIEKCCSENGTIITSDDRQELAGDLESDLIHQFLPMGRKRKVLTGLFYFLHHYIAEFAGGSKKWHPACAQFHVVGYMDRRLTNHELFQQKFPKCNYETYTGINRL